VPEIEQVPSSLYQSANVVCLTVGSLSLAGASGLGEKLLSAIIGYKEVQSKRSLFKAFNIPLA
jgi:hypothetical protein